MMPLVYNLILALAALLIFVFGYLVLLICAIAGIMFANLIYKCARFTWAQVKARRASVGVAAAKSAAAARIDFLRRTFLPAPRREGNHRFVLVRKSSL